MSKRTVFILLIIFSSLSGFAYSQEADLKKMVDSQGNVYAVDEENTMYTDGIPHPDPLGVRAVCSRLCRKQRRHHVGKIR